MRLLLTMTLIVACGCGGSGPTTPATFPKMSHEDYKKLSVEDQNDPYIKDNLEKPLPTKKKRS